MNGDMKEFLSILEKIKSALEEPEYGIAAWWIMIRDLIRQAHQILEDNK